MQKSLRISIQIQYILINELNNDTTKLLIINTQIILFNAKSDFKNLQEVTRIKFLFYIVHFVLLLHYNYQDFLILINSCVYNLNEVVNQHFIVFWQFLKFIRSVYIMLITLFLEMLKKLNNVLLIKIKNLRLIRKRYKYYVAINHLNEYILIEQHYLSCERNRNMLYKKRCLLRWIRGNILRERRCLRREVDRLYQSNIHIWSLRRITFTILIHREIDRN